MAASTVCTRVRSAHRPSATSKVVSKVSARHCRMGGVNRQHHSVLTRLGHRGHIVLPGKTLDERAYKGERRKAKTPRLSPGTLPRYVDRTPAIVELVALECPRKGSFGTGGRSVS